MTGPLNPTGAHTPDPVSAAAAWGVELVLDLDGCDRALISDGQVIRRFAAELVDTIGM
ncbi:hypothetical protein ABZS66_12125 [Dactylosporangium sp. NPDC005572]|uniref:hypothetical protein n=1 Tax=Dactylosporangium sp. NPDC005572 TaxID=3156889 RepID=UPI0033A0387B